VVAKVPIFGDLHHTFWPKSAKYRGIYQIWVHATDRWRENANFAWPKDQFSAKNHVKVPYISASGPQNSVNCIIHGGPKPQVFGGSGTGAFGGLAGVLSGVIDIGGWNLANYNCPYFWNIQGTATDAIIRLTQGRLYIAPACISSILMSGFLQSIGQIDAHRGHVTAIGQNQYNIYMQLADFTTKTEEDLVLARLNPIESPYIHPCMPGTRQWMIDKIHDWMGNHHGPNILWLSGSPGAGKSAIASTLVSTLQEAGQLGSSFFCKRDDIALSDPAACWRTIAFDLAQYDPIIAHRIVENIKGKRVDPRRADIESHYQYMIDDPLRELWRRHLEVLTNLQTNMEVDDEVNKRGTPLIAVVVDALDECGSDSSQYAQRQTFINTITKWSRLPKPFKLIVTSRDDRIPNSLRAVCHRLILETGDIAGPEAINDVRVFFAKHFAAIATQNYSLSPTWPSESIIEQLTSRAAGLFVWAETVVKFVEQGIPNRRLNSILLDQFRYGSERLDGLYRQVMNLSFQHATDDELEIYKLVVGTVVFAKIPLRQQDLRYFLGRDEEQASITGVLLNLSSVISTNAVDGCIHISHLSFTEFICDPDRCGERFVIRRDVHDRTIALACLQLMKTELRFNICQLETSHVRNVDVPNLASCIERFIPTHLSYSCRFWSDHLDTATIDAQVVDDVKLFLHTQFLFWLEVLSLIKAASIASQILMSIRKLLGVSASKFRGII
jgi:hypothetical protein